MVFILYKLYVLLPYTYPTPKLSPHRRRCISIFPQKNSLCMIYKHFKLWGHWKCAHKSPSPCNTYVIPMSLYKFVSHKPHKHAHTQHKHKHTHTQTHTHTHTTHHTHTHTHAPQNKQAVVHTAKIRHVESHSVRLQKTEICWLMLIKYYYWQYPSWKLWSEHFLTLTYLHIYSVFYDCPFSIIVHVNAFSVQHVEPVTVCLTNPCVGLIIWNKVRCFILVCPCTAGPSWVQQTFSVGREMTEDGLNLSLHSLISEGTPLAKNDKVK